MLSKFDSVDSIVSYLRAPISSLTMGNPIAPDASKINNGLGSSKKQRKEKGLTNVVSTTPPPPLLPQCQASPSKEMSSKGRVRYGPITVNPRKLPSKTLFTGRRSKYELLSTDEEEKRRDRRERNRVAATKCREKREDVLSRLENELNKESHNHKHLLKRVNDLQEQKQYLEIVLANHQNECLLMNNPSSMVFGDTGFLSSIIDAPPPLLPSYNQTNLYNEDEELSRHLLVPGSLLTNSAYDTDSSNSIFLTQQQQPPPPPPEQQQPQTMTSSSIERLINSLHSPTISLENSNNQSMLFNSAFGTSCAKQHSSSSGDDDSLPPARTNPYVY